MSGVTISSVRDFAQLLQRSQLISKSQLQEAARACGKDASPQTLASHLIGCGHLTKWQWQQLTGTTRPRFFVGKYKLLRPLGQGGMGSVFLAEHVNMRREVAIKVLPKQLAADEKMLARFHREARAVATLDHPNIVRAYEVDNVDGLHYLAMEFVAGQDLAARVVNTGPLAPELAASCIAQAAAGLAHVHGLGIVHRDIKPANLLLSEEGQIKILDLGVALLSDENHSITKGHSLGTTDYLAPEQALDSHKVDHRADIYSLGATFYFLLTGRPPFAGQTLAEVLLKHQRAEPEPMERVRAGVPPELADLCRRMMAKKPADRPQSAAEISAVLAGMGPNGMGADRSGEATQTLTSSPTQVAARAEVSLPAKEAPEPQAATPEPPLVVTAPPARASLPAVARAQANQARHRQMMLWAGGGVAVLVLAAGLVAFSPRGPSPAAGESLSSVAPRTGFVDPGVSWEGSDASGSDASGSDAKGRERKKNAAKAADRPDPPAKAAAAPAVEDDGSELPAPALVRNPGYELQLEGWTVYDDASLSDDGATGVKGARLGTGKAGVEQTVLANWTRGAKGDLRVWVKSGGPKDKEWMGVGITFFNGKEKVLDRSHTISGAAKDYRQVKVMFTVPSAPFDSVVIWAWKEPGERTLLVDDWELRGAEPVSPPTSPQAPGDLLVYEPFDYPAGSLTGRSGGAGFAGSWQDKGWTYGTPSPAIPQATVADALELPSNGAQGGAVLLPPGVEQKDAGSGGVVRRELAQGIDKGDLPLLVSFWMKPQPQPDKPAFAGYAGLELSNGKSALFAGCAQTEMRYGLGTSGKSETNRTAQPSGDPQQVVQLVVRVRLQPGPDHCELFLNPDRSKPLPERPDATYGDLDLERITAIGLTWAGAFVVDELRIGHGDAVWQRTAPK